MPVEGVAYKPSVLEKCFCAVVIFQLGLSLLHPQLHWFTLACAPFQAWYIGSFLCNAFSCKVPLWLDFSVQSLFLGVTLAAAWLHPDGAPIVLAGVISICLLGLGLPSFFRDASEVRSPLHGLVVAGTLIPTAETWDLFLAMFSIPAFTLLIVFCVMRTSWLVVALRSSSR
jgi:hypothetical protein